MVWIGRAFEVKIEGDSNDIAECSHDETPSCGTFCLTTIDSLHLSVSV